MIGDMSSDIFSRPVDVSKYDCIYGGAQKNLSMAGVTFIIIKDEVLGRVQREIPNNVGLSYTYQEGFYVQYSSCSTYLYRFREPSLD